MSLGTKFFFAFLLLYPPCLVCLAKWRDIQNSRLALP